MNVDPIEGMFMVMAIVGATFFYLGMPVILPVLFLVWKRHTLTNPRVFGALAIILCLLARFLVYRAMTEIVYAGGRELIANTNPFVVEGFFMAMIIFWLDRLFRAPT